MAIEPKIVLSYSSGTIWIWEQKENGALIFCRTVTVDKLQHMNSGELK